MKTMEEIIHDTVESLELQNKKVNKPEFEAALKKVIMEGVPLNQVFEITPEILEQVYAHAYRLYNSGNYQDASVLFAFLISINSSNPKYYMGIASSFHRMRNYENAVECYIAAYHLDGTNPIPFYHLYDCWKNLNQLEECVFALTMALELSGDNPAYTQIKERSKLALEGLIQEIEQMRSVGHATHLKDQ
jgi:type III secretion system low calcium response chaperone LcrH/SycD